MKEKQSALLTAFYRAYLKFAETGDNPYDFTPRTGLCSNLCDYVDKHLEDSGKSPNAKIFYAAVGEMDRQFKDAGLDTNYPFNHGSGRSYDLEMEQGRAFDNVHRMNWVRYRAQ